MAIVRGYQASDIEKRLKILRSQVYGKGGSTGPKGSTPDRNLPSYQFKESTQTATVKLEQNELSYLRKDMVKIAIFAVIAVTIEFVIYYGLGHNIIKLRF